jgi:hypothetical protein
MEPLPIALILAAAVAVAVALHRRSSDGTYYPSFGIGFVNHRCATESPCARASGELEQSDCYSHEARGYVRRHLSRTPLVALARVERAWDLYGADMNLEYGRTFWARPEGLATAGLIFYRYAAEPALAAVRVDGLLSAARSRSPRAVAEAVG